MKSKAPDCSCVSDLHPEEKGYKTTARQVESDTSDIECTHHSSQIRCRFTDKRCLPSHATSLHIAPCNRKEWYQEDLRTVSVEPFTNSCKESACEATLTCNCCYLLMEARSIRQHSVLRSDTVCVELKSVTRSCPSFVGDFASLERDSADRQTEDASHVAAIVSEDMCCCWSVSQCACGWHNGQSGVRWSAVYDGGDSDTHGAADLFPSNTASRNLTNDTPLAVDAVWFAAWTVLPSPTALVSSQLPKHSTGLQTMRSAHLAVCLLAVAMAAPHPQGIH